MRADGECDAERAGMAGGAKCMPAHFFGRRMKFVFKNSEIGGEKNGFGLRATDPMFVAVFGKIGPIPLEPGDLGPIDHVQKMNMSDTYKCQATRAPDLRPCGPLGTKVPACEEAALLPP